MESQPFAAYQQPFNATFYKFPVSLNLRSISTRNIKTANTHHAHRCNSVIHLPGVRFEIIATARVTRRSLRINQATTICSRSWARSEYARRHRKRHHEYHVHNQQTFRCKQMLDRKIRRKSVTYPR